MCILPKEAMTYKQQIKSNELIVKLRIFRLVKKGFTHKQIAQKFSCHRNTVTNIINCFDQKISQDIQQKLLCHNNWRRQDLLIVLNALKNKSRRPYRHPKQATVIQEAAIVSWLFYEKGLRVGPNRMKTHLKRQFSDSRDQFLLSLTKLTVRQIRGIYQRYRLKVKKVRSYTGAKVHIYNYQSLSCFQEAHFDTKYILDQKALPEQIYQQFLDANWFPRYQWTLQFAKPRFRLLAYSRHINSEFGLKYLLFCLMYIRFLFNNWEERINIGMDHGLENCKGSEIKLGQWNNMLSLLNAQTYQYHLGNDIRKNLIERSHKTDDTHFYVPRASYFTDQQSFLQEAAGYYHYFNFLRPHSGIAMEGQTPFEVIKQSGLISPERLMGFPTMILENHIRTLRKTTDFLLFNGELKELKTKKSNIKKIVDISQKYEFFEANNAQNVLTYYLREPQNY
jgi:hypothetical protein